MTMKLKNVATFAAPSILLLAMQSNAAVMAPAFDGDDNDFLAGDGIGIENFTVTTTGRSGPSIALRARNRDDADPAAAPTGDVYTVDAGLSEVQSPGQPQLQFEFMFTSGFPASEDYWLELSVDFDPTAGTDFATIALPALFTPLPGTSWAAGGSVFANNECGNTREACNWGGASSTSSFAVANSWNLGFDFWSSLAPSAAAYDPSAEGLYDISFTAFEYEAPDSDAFFGLQDPDDIFVALLSGKGDEIQTVSIQANVVGDDEPAPNPVPVPAPLALIGLGLASLATRRQRQQS